MAGMRSDVFFSFIEAPLVLDAAREHAASDPAAMSSSA
jgi:hypothetical protein